LNVADVLALVSGSEIAKFDITLVLLIEDVDE
jgi:hypothetical protein